ncbi:hypothetical protein [Tenacibaculum singaporense]|uniref:Uncharacterized protein n=1 Tax=Tenacibaculum singaporense TaxID=2358479 RepID=A0A3S8R608_9FLAO|nr:hypothetical protein [Tenacibaculum singaporense]AZJ35230.1 hypothetical protein D6T69_06725 [Tenacibaculum singaporense]
MKDIFNSIFKSSEERLKNPFIGTFIISFIAINWKPIMVLIISDKKIEDRIDYIAKNFNHLSQVLYIPLAIAIFYIGILPYIMMIFDKLTFYALSQRNENLYKNKLLDITGKKSVATSEIELENLKSDFKEKSDLNKKIKKLEEEKSLQESRIENFNDENTKLKNQLLSLEKSLNEKDRKIQELRYESKENNNQFKNYYTEYNSTPQNIVYEFVNSLHMINKYLTDSNSLNRESKNIIEQFLSLGLIESQIDNNKRKFIISDKGLYFIKRAYSDNVI